MNQSTTISTNESFYQLIDNFRNDFEDILLSEQYNVDLKLYVLQCHICNYSTTEIKKELLDFKKENPLNWSIPIIDSYLKKDCNKISRISKYTTPNDLISCIQIMTLCKIIVHKYPLPMLAGFPFENDWTTEYLKKYICLFFGVKRRTIKVNSLENYFKSPDWISKTFKNENIWKLLNFSKFYYLYIRFGKLSSNEMPEGHQYNRYVFATLIEFCDDQIGLYNDKHIFRLYRKNDEHFNRKHKTTLNITLYDILNRLLKYYDESIKSTIIINFDSIKNFKRKSFYSLKELPLYILCDTNLLNEIPSKYFNSPAVIDKIKEIQSGLDAITLKRVSDKPYYLSEMSKKIEEYCSGDY